MCRYTFCVFGSQVVAPNTLGAEFIRFTAGRRYKRSRDVYWASARECAMLPFDVLPVLEKERLSTKEWQ